MPQLRISKTNEQNALLRYKFNFDLNAARSFCSAIDAEEEKEEKKKTGEADGEAGEVAPAMWQDNGKA